MRMSLAFVASAMIGLGSIMVLVPASQASTPVTSCPATCTSACFLYNDVTCSGGSTITLSNGADLDMFGHRINCADSCGTAITMTAGGSQVTNSQSANFEAKITGKFYRGVDCGSYASSYVTGIRVENAEDVLSSESVGILNCAKVAHNVLDGHGTTWYAIQTHGVANSDYISTNYVTNYYSWDIRVDDATVSVSVDHNTVYSPNLYETNMLIRNSGSTTVSDNAVYAGANASPNSVLIQRAGTIVDPLSNFVNNSCDPTQGQCDRCKTVAGTCASPIAPYGQ